ncbi:MAG: Gfo/Idh/MocA family oxidoreductase, partial [Phycisphaerae bacterium]|nr:Gfo/Idh/MocA family oxidoreductase [Phycisphaerae bacterium]
MKKIGIGFVGAGWMGSVQLKRLTERDDVEVLALLEPNADRGREVLTEVGLPAELLVDDYDKIVSNPAIDAVWLVSPNSFHGRQAIAAMQAGKHVFCEKPAATDFDDFCKEIELERANPDLITFVDYILYFDTMESHLQEMISDGKFGQITQIQVNYRHPVNIAGDKVWKLRKDIMGDAIGMGINHSISVIVNLMSPQAKPVGVYATSMPAKVRGFEADPVWNILVKFDNGATGFCFGNIDNGNGYDAYHNLFGTEGGFVFESQLDRAQKVRYWSAESTDGKWVYPLDVERCKQEGAEALIWPADTTTPDSGNVIEHQTGECVGHFIECVKSGEKSPLSFVNSITIAEIGWAAQISAATGNEVALPLDWDKAKQFF